MNAKDLRLSLPGKIVVTLLLALALFGLMHITPTFPYKALLALFIMGLIALALGHSTLRLRPLTAPSAPAGDEELGSVKWFNAKKGFGFITTDGGAEVFMHFKQIEDGEKRQIKPGTRVSFLIVQAERGPQAETIRLLD